MISSAVLYSFSGPRNSGKTTIYQAVTSIFNTRYPSLLPHVTFLGNVLGDLPPPGEDHSTTTLLKGWASLNEACVRLVRPALAKGKIVVVDQFGLDVYLNAVACRDCHDQQHKAFVLHHHHMVPARIVTEEIRPPIYLIRDDRHIGNTVPLRAREQEEIARYFAPGTGQNPPRYLKGVSVLECAEDAVWHILQSIPASVEVEEAVRA
ncbi:MAG: hypothetical protein RLZZ26_261 [Candidatus Parcubacteria bacterium]|jgi:hypothetical protein